MSTIFFDHINGKVEQTYPCRCGVTHTGPYAGYEFGHHNCFHDSRLTPVNVDDGHYVCPDCGKDFWLG